MQLEKKIAEYIKKKGIVLTVISRETGIAYMSLYDSLFNGSKKRQLRGSELIAICEFLEVSPMVFAEKKETKNNPKCTNTLADLERVKNDGRERK